MDHDQINTKIKDTHHFYGIGINIIHCKSTVALQFPIYGEYLTKRDWEWMLSNIQNPIIYILRKWDEVAPLIDYYDETST